MKKSFKILAAAIASAFCLASCEEMPETSSTPEIKFGQTEISLDSDGAAVTIGYMVENAIDGESISVDYDADWLTVNTEKARAIEFSATQNESGAERSVDVDVLYSGAKTITLTVTQSYYESPITIETSDLTATGLKYNITTANPELTWIAMVTKKASFESFETFDELIANDLEYFAYLADIQDLTLSEFLAETLYTGSRVDGKFQGLTPGTSYVLYAYGLTTEGKRTTDVVHYEFTTLEASEVDITFEFEVSEDDFVLEYTITPSTTGVSYYFGVVKESVLNEWKELYGGDLRTAIQKGDIDAKVQQYIDRGFIDDASGYFEMYTENDIMDWGWEELEASTKYIIYAARWNEECQLQGEVCTYEHTSEAVKASDNQITLSVQNITQSSADAVATTTNDDSYVIIPVKSSDIKDMSDEEIFTYVKSEYEVLLDEYIFEGDRTKTYSRMRPDTDYTFLAFGYKAGIKTTTSISKADFTTLPTGDPADCTFEFYIEADTDYAWVEVTPSDKGHYYHWMVYPSYYTADDAKNYLGLLIKEAYEDNFAAFASWELSQGDDGTSAWDLIPNTEYKVGAIIMDYDTGEFLSEMIFSEPFKTKEVVYADVTINMTHGEYYDLNELIAAGYTEYEEHLSDGDAILPVSISVEGECSEFYYDIYNNDLSDTVKYPDEIFYDGLWYGSYYESSVFVVSYDKPMTLVAIAYDDDYNASHLYREVLNFTKEGAAPVENFNISKAPAKKAAANAKIVYKMPKKKAKQQ